MSLPQTGTEKDNPQAAIRLALSRHRLFAGCLFCLFLFLFLPNRVLAYGVSVILEQKEAKGFSSLGYGYSSLFRQGRDNFHWLDLTFAEYDYHIKDEVGSAEEIGSVYRFARRLRWARYFKPLVITEVGIVRLELNARRQVSSANEFVGSLPARSTTDYRAALGAGYLWETGSVVWMLGAKAGYIHSFRMRYLGTLFQVSFEF